MENEQQLHSDEDLIKKFQGGGVDLETLVEVFNPKNASTIPVDIMGLMQHLTTDQISALAKAYPNQATGNSYLILKDLSNKGKQLYPRSTWPNLFELRKLTRQDSHVALSFSSRFQGSETATLKAALSSSEPVQDIKEITGSSLPGIKQGGVQHLKEASEENSKDQKQEDFSNQNNNLTASESPAGATSSKEPEFEDLTVDQIRNEQGDQPSGGFPLSSNTTGTENSATGDQSSVSNLEQTNTADLTNTSEGGSNAQNAAPEAGQVAPEASAQTTEATTGTSTGRRRVTRQ